MSKPKSSKVEVEEGIYFMVAKTIGDIGTQTVTKYNSDEEEEKKQVIIVVELPELSTKGKPATLSKWATNSGSAKSFGGKLAKALGLKPGWDWNDLLDRPFQAPVTHTESGNAKIGDPVALKKGTKIPACQIKGTTSCFLDENFNKEDFEAMPEFIQNAMIKAPEFDEVEGKLKKGKDKGKDSKSAAGNKRK